MENYEIKTEIEVPIISGEELKSLLGIGWISSSEKLPDIGCFWGVVEKIASEETLFSKKYEKYTFPAKVYRNSCMNEWQLDDDYVTVLYWMPIHDIPTWNI
jgi:hypothetical protein